MKDGLASGKANLIDIQVAEDAITVLPANATRQALLALVKNALESSANGKRVTLAAQCAQGRVAFTVQDAGSGMAPETLRRISEPFFTTKGTGRGLGLGTFLVRLFAERLNGSLTFESEAGAGTTALLELPLLHMTEKDKPAALIVDDDDVFHNRLRRAFELRGWEAHVAASGEEALIRARETGPDLAIVDLRMPGESGLDVVKSLRELDATISIIILTGYGSIATALEAVRCGADYYLSKPVDVDQILSTYEAVSFPRWAKLHHPPPFPVWREWNGSTSNAF